LNSECRYVVAIECKDDVGLRYCVGDNRDKFVNIIEEMLNVHAAKAHDYGDSLDAVADLEMKKSTGIMVLMTIKWRRLVNLVKKSNRVAESRRDTALDLANYAVLLVDALDEEVDISEAISGIEIAIKKAQSSGEC